MTGFERLKGFRDFYPEEMEARSEVFQNMRDTVESNGFRKFETPAVEELDLYRIKSGEELIDETFNFEDHGGREITLIPELTPSVARMIQKRKDLKRPIKWYSIPRCWRYESPQKGRLREFKQLNCDIVGVDNAKADAEIIFTATEVMRSLGLEKAYKIKLNDRNFIEAICESFEIEDTDTIISLIDDKEKLTEEEFIEKLEEQGLSEKDAKKLNQITNISGTISEVIDDIRNVIPDSKKVNDSFNRIRSLQNYLEEFEISEKCLIDLSIVRGLDYYTGLVFEGFDEEEELRAIFGGGRYDEYLELFGDQSLPAVGFGMGDAVLEELMKREGEWPEEKIRTDVYILNTSKQFENEAISLAKTLRKDQVKTEIDLTDRGFTNQLQYADSINAKFVVILGDETDENQVEVKNMETGKERVIDKDNINRWIRDKCQP